MSTTAVSPILRAETVHSDPVDAVAELAAALDHGRDATVVLFCSDHYDPDALAGEIALQFQGPVIGCTTAGEIGLHYQEGGIVAIAFRDDDFRVHTRLIPSLESFDTAAAGILVEGIRSRLVWNKDLSATGMFAVALLDGLSVREEPVTAYLQSALRGVDLIGGSAGDNLVFRQTRILCDGRFHLGAGVVAVVESKLPFSTFKLQHFEPGDEDIVITRADPERRIVYEINGAPAAEEFASLLGLPTDRLTPQTFSTHPLMLQIGEDWYVRSIQRMNDDGSLTLFCAIDEGLVLTLARGVGFVKTLRDKVAELTSGFRQVHGTLGFDCILRRLEAKESGLMPEAAAVLAPLKFVGFSTFGEQYGAVHVNQTLTGVAIGER